jgi:hypothetical protein
MSSFRNRIEKFFQGVEPEPLQLPNDPPSKTAKGSRPSPPKNDSVDQITEPLCCDRGCKRWFVPRARNLCITVVYLNRAPEVNTFSTVCVHCRLLIVFTEYDFATLAKQILDYERRHRRGSS